LVKAVDNPDEFFTLEKQLERHSREDLLFDLPSVDELNDEGLSNRPPFINAADSVVRFMEPLFDSLKNITRKEGNVELVVRIFVEYAKCHPHEKLKLMQELGVTKLSIPVISVDLPVRMIVEYNRMEGTDPKVLYYYTHPIFGEEIRVFGLFLDKYDTEKSVICSIVWSTVDQGVVPLTNIYLKPYPLCWNSKVSTTPSYQSHDLDCKNFGEKRCGRCGISRYCSRDCQLHDWQRHKDFCATWRRQLERSYVIDL